MNKSTISIAILAILIFSCAGYLIYYKFLYEPGYSIFTGEKTHEYFVRKAFEAEETNDYVEALINFNSAIELSPENESYYFQRSFLKAKMDDLPGAIEDMSQSIRYSKNPQTQYLMYEHRAEYYFDNGEYLKAKKDLTTEIEIGPIYSTYGALNMRAIVNLNLKDWESAIKDCNEAILIMNNDEEHVLWGDVYYHKAIANYQLGNIIEACVNYSLWQLMEETYHARYLHDISHYSKLFKDECK